MKTMHDVVTLLIRKSHLTRPEEIQKTWFKLLEVARRESRTGGPVTTLPGMWDWLYALLEESHLKDADEVANAIPALQWMVEDEAAALTIWQEHQYGQPVA